MIRVNIFVLVTSIFGIVFGLSFLWISSGKSKTWDFLNENIGKRRKWNGELYTKEEIKRQERIFSIIFLIFAFISLLLSIFNNGEPLVFGYIT